MTEILEIAQLGCIDLLEVERGKKITKKNNNTKFLTGITFTGI